MKRIYYLMMLAIFAPGLIYAQPANDNCSGALPIEVNGAAVIADNSEATYYGPEGSCYAPLGDMTDGNVWFTFTITETMTVLITTEEGTSDDSQLTLFTIDNCGETNEVFSEVACNEDVDWVNYMSEIVIGDLEPGTYYLAASTFSRADASGGPITNAGTYSISISTASMTGNDTCEGAIELILDGSAEIADNSISTINGPSGSCYGIDQLVGDTWFMFTTTEVMDVRVHTEDINSGDSQVSVFTIEGCGTDDEVYTEVGCNEDIGNGNYMSQVDMYDLPAGTYYIKAGTYHEFFTGSYSISLQSLNEVGINEIHENSLFSVYPNPNNGNFSIVNAGVSGNYTIELIDLSGRTIHGQTTVLNASSETNISVKGIASGVYMLRMINTKDNSFSSQRIVVK